MSQRGPLSERPCDLKELDHELQRKSLRLLQEKERTGNTHGTLTYRTQLELLKDMHEIIEQYRARIFEARRMQSAATVEAHDSPRVHER